MSCFQKTFVVLSLVFCLPIQCADSGEEGKKMAIKVTSNAFEEGAFIPSKHTCDGVNVSPQLKIEGVPKDAKSLVLICDDPDAPVGTWVHWVLYDLPAGTGVLEEKIPPDKTLKNGGVHGTNDFKKLGYGGPCPPSGTHRYFFKVYAADRTLGLDPGATKKEVLKAIEGHVLAEGQLMGKYKR
jgi:Raf kinase inhibitor-like YbhB/YbcL family protein